MIKSPWLYLLSLMVLAGCKSEFEEVVYTNEQQEYTETYQVFTGTTTKHGPYTKRNLDGEVMEESTYQQGVMDGIQKIYDKGVLYSISNFEKGRLNGHYQTFYPDGRLNVEGDYIYDVMEGKWKRYYPSGDLMEEVNFQNNQENGPFVEFYPNGNIKAEGTYLNGDNEHGDLFLYDIYGILIKKMNCKLGICRTTWVKEGKEDWEGFRNE